MDKPVNSSHCNPNIVSYSLAQPCEPLSVPAVPIEPNAMTDDATSPFQMDEDMSCGAAPEPDIPRLPPSSGGAPKMAKLDPMTPTSAKLLRSRLDRIKVEDAATTTEDELTYEEDADDKYDGDASPTAVRLDAALAPPENFAPVINKIYRSSFPQPPNFSFLRTLRLKLVLCLIPEEYPQLHLDFFKLEGIRFFQLGMLGNKEPFVKISSELITEAIKIVIDPANQPILVHCNRGKHRTGCLVGVLRRLQGWLLTITFDEYRKFAAPKERPMDQQFIELYNHSAVLQHAQNHNLLPLAWDG